MLPAKGCGAKAARQRWLWWVLLARLSLPSAPQNVPEKKKKKVPALAWPPAVCPWGSPFKWRGWRFPGSPMSLQVYKHLTKFGVLAILQARVRFPFCGWSRPGFPFCSWSAPGSWEVAQLTRSVVSSAKTSHPERGKDNLVLGMRLPSETVCEAKRNSVHPKGTLKSSALQDCKTAISVQIGQNINLVSPHG